MSVCNLLNSPKLKLNIFPFYCGCFSLHLCHTECHLSHTLLGQTKSDYFSEKDPLWTPHRFIQLLSD